MSGYVGKIAGREAARHVRRRSKYPDDRLTSELVSALFDPGPSPVSEWERKEQRDQARAIVATIRPWLADQTYRSLVMRWVDGVTGASGQASRRRAFLGGHVVLAALTYYCRAESDNSGKPKVQALRRQLFLGRPNTRTLNLPNPGTRTRVAVRPCAFLSSTGPVGNEESRPDDRVASARRHGL
jgi:hypothetical protein